MRLSDLADEETIKKCAEEFEVFPAGEKAVDGPLLRHIADESADNIRFANRIVTQDASRARRRRQQRDERPERGAFPRPIRPQQTENLACINLKRQLGDGCMAIIGFREPGHLDRNGAIHQPQPFAPD